MSSVPVRPAAPWKCHNCGRTNSPDRVACKKCNTPFDPVLSTAPDLVKKRPLWRSPFGFILLTVLACVGCSLIYAVTPAGREGAANSQATITARAISAAATANAPTATAPPTETPLPPTETPEPSVTPEPTATLDPVAIAQNEYREFVIEISEEYREGADVFSEQNLAASEDPTLIFDQDWIIQTAVGTVLIEQAAERVLAREAPPEPYVGFDAEFKRAAEMFQQSMQVYRQGVDEFDGEKIQESTRLMNEGVSIINSLPLDEMR